MVAKVIEDNCLLVMQVLELLKWTLLDCGLICSVHCGRKGQWPTSSTWDSTHDPSCYGKGGCSEHNVITIKWSFQKLQCRVGVDPAITGPIMMTFLYASRWVSCPAVAPDSTFQKRLTRKVAGRAQVVRSQPPMWEPWVELLVPLAEDE